MKIVLMGLGIGLAAGLVGALCGVGGGILMVPAFALALGMPQKSAVATSLAIVVVTALAGTLNNGLHDLKNRAQPDLLLIDWRLVLFTGLAAGVAAWFGTDLMRQLSNQNLTRIFGVLLVLVGVRMLLVKA